ncbi:hypothetical protein [Intestinimonas butyriciproducens]|uniref:hypothetical protein n=1 Tax=Intestinimonas butyriciproducens TaxID=1297617 RepID=UPI00195BE479|nr:hypothetical protein [Intestinimonas butyriciproducens]MBM6976828.1 hypothetical protein [Intestinimonas butyriciproducens]
MADWKKDEVNYRLAKMVLQTLMHKGLLDEFEVDQVLQHLRANSSALIASIEEDALWQKQ